MVYVEWYDHNYTEGWVQLEDAGVPTGVLIRSVGFMLKESPQAITIASELDSEHGSAFSPVTILKADIRKKKRLAFPNR